MFSYLEILLTYDQLGPFSRMDLVDPEISHLYNDFSFNYFKV